MIESSDMRILNRRFDYGLEHRLASTCIRNRKQNHMMFMCVFISRQPYIYIYIYPHAHFSNAYHKTSAEKLALAERRDKDKNHSCLIDRERLISIMSLFLTIVKEHKTDLNDFAATDVVQETALDPSTVPQVYRILSF